MARVVPEDRSRTYARHLGDLIDSSVEASLGDHLHSGAPNARACERLLLLSERKRTSLWCSHGLPRLTRSSLPPWERADTSLSVRWLIPLNDIRFEESGARHCSWALGIHHRSSVRP